ncbi:MAG: diguanylate cyclase/phosphodiesterase (GGDEF & EAL domains) with PAS/PAC sensor(s) [Rhodanobacteraceae bacterium]|nr:MAG: diguanylate cyclase/phosphodiesterase (GGDEF & EAL domains) with PAS/PAC sensor(s) [Rhodanobacteraceae bacterium]
MRSPVLMHAMRNDNPTQPSTGPFRRRVLLAVIVAGLLATASGWYVQAVRAPLSPVMVAIQVTTIAVLGVLFVAAWFKWLPQRAVEFCCLLYIVAICLACMALRMYSARYGAGIHFETLYLWIPLIYLFAFMVTDHKVGLVLSLGILALFVGVSLPFLLRDLGGRYANFTLQLHMVSAAMIAMLYFFSGYQHRLRLAEAAVGKLANLSNTDDLTQLSNRRRMAAALETELERFAGGGNGFAVLLFDVDHFKAINDQFGHGAGDAALVALAAHATELFGGMGELGRWGGDEFVAMVRSTNLGDASCMANALCVHVASEPLHAGRPVTISCGVTAATPDDSIDSLLQRADAALYAAKHAGRNRVECIASTGRAEATVAG